MTVRSTLIVNCLGLILGLVSLFAGPLRAHAAEFVEEVERDFPLKTTGSLKVLNQRGSISVVGWTMDRLRVKVRRRVEAANAEEAKRVFESLELAFRDHGSDLELLVEGGRGMDLSTRLKERKTPRATVDLEVRGPANLKLELWGVQSRMRVHNWNASISARASSGEMSFSSVSTTRGSIAAICADCGFDFKEVHANLRCVTEKGKIRLENVTSSEVFAESSSGAIEFFQVHGVQTYVTTTGKIEGRSSSGTLEFRTRGGDVSLAQMGGSLSGHTDGGAIHLDVAEWGTKDRVTLETETGSIDIRLPYHFTSLIDLWAQDGKVDSDVEARPLHSTRKKSGSETPIGQRVRGTVGSPVEEEEPTPFSRDADLRVLTRKGSIRVRRSGEVS